MDQTLSAGAVKEAVQPSPQPGQSPLIEARYYIVTADGAQHPLGRAATNTYRSVDEAGYLFTPSNSGDYPLFGGGGGGGSITDPYFLTSVAGTITDSQGVTYTPNAITDPDGNVIQLSNGGFPIVDSTNRTILNSVPANDTSQCPVIPGAQFQPAVSASIWTPPGTDPAHPYIFCATTVTISTHFSSSVRTLQQFTQPFSMLQSIVLPNKQFWGFVYDAADPNNISSTGLGQLTKLIYPTGGSVSYSYPPIPFRGFCNEHRPTAFDPNGESIKILDQQVSQRTMYDSDGTLIGQLDYGYPDLPGAGFTGFIHSIGHTYTVTKFVADQTVASTNPDDISCHYLDAGKIVYDGDSAAGTLLQEVTNDYLYPVVPGAPAVSVPRVHHTTTVFNGSSTTTITKQYDSTLSFSEESCFRDTPGCQNPADSGSVPIGGATSTTYTDFTGAVLKADVTKYKWALDSNYLNTNLLDIPAETDTDDASGSPVAYTTYAYDDPTYSTGGGIRGHLTTTTSFLNTGASPTTHMGWNGSGQKIYAIDADVHTNSVTGHTVDYQYTQCNNSYLSGSTNALNQSTSGGYDCNTGLLTSFTDANSKISSFGYDAMSRVTSASYPDGGSTAFNYEDSLNTVQRSILATPDPTETTTVVFDGFGRELHRIMSDSPSNDTVDTTYDLNGRVASVSNPYRSTTDPTYGVTTYVYDALGRKTLETEADGTSQLRWDYSQAPTIKSTDEDGNSWARTSDSLGRLTTVVEPTNLTTSYAYNPPGDLTDVNQFGVVGQDATRSRHFAYDSLSRLITANNPETGTICYGQWSGANCINGYDANGNLLSKTDARNISTNYAYDSLNRLASKTYTDGTPPANYYYDIASTNGIGRLSTATVGGANVYAAYYYQYDAVGRLQRKNFQLPDATGNGMQTNIGASGDSAYDLAGHVTFTDTGVGVHEMFTRDSAGHVVNATSNAHTTGFLNGIASFNIYLNASYTPLGGLATRTLGNGLTEIRSYDKRGRQTSTTQAQTGSSIGYSVTTAYDPVGNPSLVSDSVNGTWAYSYDSLNRLHLGISLTGLTLDWEYDAFGNRKSQIPSGIGSAPQMSLSFNNPNNQVDPGNNITYDAAGNVTTDNQGQTYTYDAEERISSMTHLGGAPTIYKYDSEGNLVYESGASGVQVFLRNAAGQPVTVYPPSGYTGPSPYQNIIAYVDGEDIGLWHNGVFNWSGKDTVGTKRYVTWGKGDLASSTQPQLIGSFTSLPFGDALSSIGTSPIHFTGKERDTESGNDYFGARYYSSAMGRYMSPDWSKNPQGVPYADFTNPQTLNLYSYVKNNPLSAFDDDGHATIEVKYNPLAAGSNHSFIVITDRNGTQTVFRAGPSVSASSGWITPATGGSASQSATPTSSQSNSSNSSSPGAGPTAQGNPWGQLVAQQESPTDPNGDNMSTISGSIVVMKDDLPAASYIQGLQDFDTGLNQANIPYNPLSTNSNAYVTNALQSIGVAPPIDHPRAPGAGTNLNVTPAPPPPPPPPPPPCSVAGACSHP
jgi:RHS repeat-associated protein